MGIFGIGLYEKLLALIDKALDTDCRMAVFAGFSRFEAFFVRFQVSCFTDGGGVFQSGRDYWHNQDHSACLIHLGNSVF
jgi:hypothetical protein